MEADVTLAIDAIAAHLRQCFWNYHRVNGQPPADDQTVRAWVLQAIEQPRVVPAKEPRASKRH